MSREYSPSIKEYLQIWFADGDIRLQSAQWYVGSTVLLIRILKGFADGCAFNHNELIWFRFFHERPH